MESRIKTRSPGADADVQILLANVKTRPESPTLVYSTIALAIKWYHEIGEDQKAQRFLGQLEEVGETIVSERILKEVQDGIAVLKKSFAE